jgi:hypothetical protein
MPLTGDHVSCQTAAWSLFVSAGMKRVLSHFWQSSVRHNTYRFDGRCSRLRGRWLPGMRRDRSAVSAGLDQFWSNGKVEWQAHRLKLLKRQMHGRSGSLLLRRRVLPFYPTVEARHLTHYEVPTKVRKNLFQTGADTFSCRTPQEDREEHFPIEE